MAGVLLTGGNGFLASHILDLLLAQGRSVVTTARSERKADQIYQLHPDLSPNQLKVIVIQEFTTPGAFDKCFEWDTQFDVVIHTASPFRYAVTDIQRELLDPAIIGTTLLLKTIQDKAPSVKKVIITSSFASILNSYKDNSCPEYVYSEDNWNPLTMEDAYLNPLNGYRASKMFAERAAWEFMERRKPTFSLVTMCPTLMFGPVLHPPPTLDELNTSNQRVRNFIAGDYKVEIPDTGASFFLWIDVRDAALAHVKAMDAPKCENKRFLLTAGYFSNKEICEVIREFCPEYEERLPEKNIESGGYPKGGVYGFDNSRASKELGLTYRTLTESITDTVVSLQKLQKH